MNKEETDIHVIIFLFQLVRYFEPDVHDDYLPSSCGRNVEKVLGGSTYVSHSNNQRKTPIRVQEKLDSRHTREVTNLRPEVYPRFQRIERPHGKYEPPFCWIARIKNRRIRRDDDIVEILKHHKRGHCKISWMQKIKHMHV